MDQIKTGNIIRTMRLRQGMTQRGLAEKILSSKPAAWTAVTVRKF